MLVELCTRNLFLLDKLWINNFIWRCWNNYAMVYGKNDQKYGAAVIGSFTTTMPLPTQPWVCGIRQHDGYPSSSPFTWPCAMCLFLFPCMKSQMKGRLLLMSAKCKRKRWKSWTTSALKSSRNVFSSGKNVGASVSNQKENTLKETRVVIVWNLINHFKKIIPVIFGFPLACYNAFDSYNIHVSHRWQVYILLSSPSGWRLCKMSFYWMFIVQKRYISTHTHTHTHTHKHARIHACMWYICTTWQILWLSSQGGVYGRAWRNAYKFLVERPEGRRPRCRHRWEDNPRMVAKEMEWEVVSWALKQL